MRLPLGPAANPPKTVGRMIAPIDKTLLASRWDERHAATLTPPELLLYRSNLLGSDLRITNFGGGNTSAKLDERDPLTGEAGHRPVGEGVGRRPRIDQARRLRHALSGEARRAEDALSRADRRRRDGRLSAPLHVQPQSARRLDRHAAARLPALCPCRSHASRCGDRHRRVEELARAHAGRSTATASAGCRGGGRDSSSG